MSNTIVRTNVMSLNSHRNLGLVGNQQSRASQRLSSGFRINSAADDAAGLGISEKMRSQIRGLDQASRNGQDGISLIQTAEGAMSTINEMVTRVRELVVQAANDTNAHDLASEATWSQSDRTRIQAEINQLMDEIDATRNRVEFNTRRLIDGSLGGGSVGRGLSGEMRLIAERFVNENQEEVNSLQDERADIVAYRDYLNAVLNWQDELLAIQAFVGPDDNTMGGGLRNTLTNALMSVAQAWSDGIARGLITDTTHQAQATFIENNIGNHLGARFAGSAYRDLRESLGETLAAIITDTEIEDADGLSLDLATIQALVGEIEAGDLESIQDLFVEAMAAQVESPLEPDIRGSTAGDIERLDTPEDAQDLWDLLDSTHADSIATHIGDIGEAIADASGEVADLLDTLNAAFNDPDGDWAELAERFDGDVDAMLRAFLSGEPGDGTPLWFQIGANANQGVHLSIQDVGVDALSRVGTVSNAVLDAIRVAFDREGNQLDLGNLNMEQFAAQFTFDQLRSRMEPDDIETSTAYGATGGVLRMSGEEINLFITSIDLALSHVTDQRSNLGAMQNRLEFTIENLDIASENLSAAESRIRDADMAREMMRLTQANVLQQAAISMLAQANQAPQSVLQLLG